MILIKGVSFKSILISFPRPEAALSATAFKKLPLSFEPTEYFVLLSAPLTFLTSNSDSSISVNSKTLTSLFLEALITNPTVQSLRTL